MKNIESKLRIIERKFINQIRSEPLVIFFDENENLYFEGDVSEKPGEMTFREFQKAFAKKLRLIHNNRFLAVTYFVPVPSKDD